MEKVSIKFPNKGGIVFSESVSVKKMMEGLKTLIKEGAIKGNIDDILLDYTYDKETGVCTAELDKESIVKPDAIPSVGGSLSLFVDDKVTISDKGFSIASIQERLRVSSMDTRMKFRYTILDYKRYYKSNKGKLEKDPSILKRLRELFRIDMMGIFNEVLPYIEEGKQLQQLTGLTTITTGLNSISRDLSLSYRRALKQSKTGQISKNVFQKLQVQYNEFMKVLTDQVLPDIGKDTGESDPEDKKFSDITVKSIENTVSVTTNKPSELSELLKTIQDLSLENTEVTLKLITDDKTVEKILDLQGLINTVSTSIKSHQSYQYVSDGRIKLL